MKRIIASTIIAAQFLLFSPSVTAQNSENDERKIGIGISLFSYI